MTVSFLSIAGIVFGLVLKVIEAIWGETESLAATITWSDIAWVLVHILGVMVMVAGVAQAFASGSAYVIGLVSGLLSGLITFLEKYVKGPVMAGSYKRSPYN